MRKFDTELSSCINERQYNEIMYGRKDQYIPFGVDYKDDIQILCVRDLMKNLIERSPSYDMYTFAVLAASEGIFPPLDACLDYDLAKGETHEISEYIIQKLKKEYGKVEKSKTLDDLGTLQEINQNLSGKSIFMEKMLEALDACQHVFYIKDTIPKEMNPIIEKYIKMLYGILELKAKPTLVPNKNQPTGKENELAQKGVFVRKGVIVLKDIIFYDLSETAQILDMLDDRIPNINRAVFFDHCCFDIPCWGLCSLTKKDILFKNCHFKRAFKWMGQEEAGSIILDNCVISDSMEFTPNNLMTVYINDCIFEKDSILKFDHATKCREQRAYITDSVFYGDFELSDWENLELQLKNITFYSPFTIKKVTFNNKTKIANLCFPSVITEKMANAQKQLHDALVNSDLKELAESLNLLANNKQKKTSFDYEAYQAAYDSGWLKPEFAAYFLGKSANYLAKKRMDDKKKLTQQSLPFKGDAKDIQYPVDALLAFKAKDWNKLKELRKKYTTSS